MRNAAPIILSESSEVISRYVIASSCQHEKSILPKIENLSVVSGCDP